MRDAAIQPPIHWFKVNIRPAELMLTVYQLFNSGNHVLREGAPREENR